MIIALYRAAIVIFSVAGVLTTAALLTNNGVLWWAATAATLLSLALIGLATIVHSTQR